MIVHRTPRLRACPLLLIAVAIALSPAARAAALDSPRAVVQAFMTAMSQATHDPADRAAWNQAVACLHPDTAAGDPESARDVAQALFHALNHVRTVELDKIPDAAAAQGEAWYTYFPVRTSADDQALVQSAGLRGERISIQRLPQEGWRFSRQTAAAAGAMSQKLDALQNADPAPGPPATTAAPRGIELLIPPRLRTAQALGVRLWQWAALGLLLFAAVVIDVFSKAITGRLLSRLLRGAPDDQRELVHRATRPVGLLIAAWLVFGGLHLLGLGGPAGVVLFAAVNVFLVLAGVLAGWRLLDVLAAYVLLQTQRTETKFDDVLVPLIRKGLKLLVLAVGLVYAAKAMSIDILPLLTGLGIGSLAFAFAAKDTIENFFGSIAVILDRPFEVGDWVVIGDVEGTVEELGFRSTRVRTFYNSQTTVPNATLVRATVDNYGRRKYRRWKTHLGLQYDTPPDLLVAFTEGVRELVRTHPYTRKDYYQVWLHQWSASSMDVLLYVFFEVPDWNTELRERERLFIDVVRLADQLGVQFAFPTQTVHLHRAEDGPDPVPAELPTSMTDRRSLIKGIRTAQQIIAGQPWRDHKPGPQTYGQVGPTPIDEAGNEILDPTAPTAQAPPANS